MANTNMNINATVNLPDAKEVNKQIRALEKKINPLEINSKLDDAGIENATNRLKDLNAAAASVESGKTCKGFFRSLADGIKEITSGIGAGDVLKNVVTASRRAISTVRDLDTVLVDLKKTSKMSTGQLVDFYYSANDIAKQMGVSTREIITQAAAWSRLGFNTADAASKMAKYSSMFAAISEGMDSDTATNGLASIMEAFKIGLEDTDEVLDGIMSKISIIGNTQSISNSDIVDFLTNSADAMAAANNTLEDTIALGAAMLEITGNAAGAGDVLKAVSMRIRGYDEETNEFIGGVDELSEKIANLTRTSATPDGISLFSDKEMTEYKSTRQLLQEISEIYDRLTAKDREELLGAIAGTQNSQAVSDVLSNFGTVTDSLESMKYSAGNAEAEMASAMDTIDFKLNKVKETGTGIAQNLFEREDIKSVLDIIAALGSALDRITDKLGLLGTIGLSAGLFSGFKNVGRDKMYSLICFESADNNMCSLVY